VKTLRIIVLACAVLSTAVFATVSAPRAQPAAHAPAGLHSHEEHPVQAQPPARFAAAPARTAATDVVVQISNFAFQPATLAVAPGTTVTWVNGDDEPHTVSANDRSYRSTPLDTNQRYTHTYNSVGEYHYFCSLHPHMTGVVIVRALAPSTSPARGS